MTRREQREALFALLFEMSFSEITSSEDILALEKQERDWNIDYIVEGYRGTVAHLSEIDALIEQFSNGWKLSRISKPTLAILRLATFEMLYTNVPYSVAINEAVELAKKYDHEKAPAFVNGILNKIADNKGIKNKTNE